MQQPASAPSPFITRRSVGVACAGVIVSALVVGSARGAQDTAGLAIALGWGVFAVSLVVAYAGAVVLALRVRSILLLCLVFLIPVPPFGPLLCVLLSGTLPGRGPRL